MNRRDLLLQEMQITQWVLTRPQVLKGEAQIHLNEQTKLVVVCDEEHRQSTFLYLLQGRSFAEIPSVLLPAKPACSMQ